MTALKTANKRGIRARDVAPKIYEVSAVDGKAHYHIPNFPVSDEVIIFVDGVLRQGDYRTDVRNNDIVFMVALPTTGQRITFIR